MESLLCVRGMMSGAFACIREEGLFVLLVLVVSGRRNDKNVRIKN